MRLIRAAAPTAVAVSTCMLAALVMLAALPEAARACRCAQRPLADYFADAELVFVGRVVSSAVVDAEPPHRAVRFNVQGKPYKGDPGTLDSFATPLSSATCGYAVTPERLYLVFASRHAPDARIAWFDTCNGTRGFDARAPGGVQGFADVPAAEVLPRLAALRAAIDGTDPRTTATARLPRPGDPRAQIVGLLEIPAVLGDGAGTPGRAVGLSLYDEPRADAPRRASAGAVRELVTREVAYEQPAAVVRERRPGWYRIALADGRGAWVRAEDGGPFHALPALLVNRLAYLGPHWDGWVWPEPGAGYPQTARRVADPEQPVNIVATQEIGGSLWLHVEVLDASPCDGGSPKVSHAGWVPAYTPNGEPVAWFYSRGC